MATKQAIEIQEGVIKSKNPLVVIGWTYAILLLKLTDDQYYTKALKEAQMLAAMKHEDKGNSKEVSQHYIEAYTTLQDREKFNAAMKVFRAERNSQRRYESELTSSLTTQNNLLKKKVEDMLNERKNGKNGVERLSRVATNLSRYVAGQSMDLDVGTDSMTYLASIHRVKSLEVIKITFPNPAQLKKKKKLPPNHYMVTANDFRDSMFSEYPKISKRLDFLNWPKIRDFLDKFAPQPSAFRLVSLEAVTVEVTDGLFRDYLSDHRILGSMKASDAPKSGFRLDNGDLFGTIDDVSEVIMPHVVLNNFLLIDTSPTLKMALPVKDHIANVIVEKLDTKLNNFRFFKEEKSQFNISKLEMFGMVVGINMKD